MPSPLMRSRKTTAQVIVPRQERVSPRLRGYSSRWDRMSATLRKREPFCRWCRETGRLEFAKMVDHKFPVADGGPVLDPANAWPLCLMHHGVKAELENYARQHGLLHMLPIWCDQPDERPAKFRTSHEARQAAR